MSIGDNVEKLESIYIADENLKWHSRFGKQSTVPQIIEHCLCFLLCYLGLS